MKFKFARVSDDEWREDIELFDLSDVLELVKKYKNPVVISENSYGADGWAIQIVDDDI